MKILCFDTSFDKTYITLGENGNILVSEIIESTEERYHSAFLIPKIAEILKNQNILMQDIAAVGVNVGPGSFTGIRVCVSVARVMAQSLEIPAVGVSSLEIIAHGASQDFPIAVLMDARKGKAYIGVYSAEGRIILEPQAIEYETVFEMARSNDYFVMTDNTMFEKLSELGVESVRFSDLDADFGKNLFELADNYLKSEDGEKYKWYNLKPLYIQPPPISMPKIKA